VVLPMISKFKVNGIFIISRYPFEVRRFLETYERFRTTSHTVMIKESIKLKINAFRAFQNNHEKIIILDLQQDFLEI
jgi:hypothetical protein